MVRGEGNGTTERRGVRGQAGEEVLMEVLTRMVWADVQVDGGVEQGVRAELGNDWCGVSGSRSASGKRSCAVEEHLTFASTVRRDLQRPIASVQRFLIDCAGRRFDCRAALAF